MTFNGLDWRNGKIVIIFFSIVLLCTLLNHRNEFHSAI
jgi:hypothetical protein